jgi:Mrp family chromosome partitioning ATPase
MIRQTGESPSFSHRAISRQAWLTARARNAVHRPVFIGAVGIGTFIAVLVSLVITPLQARRSGSPASATRGPRPDTSIYANAVARARVRLAAAESALVQSRAAATSGRAAPAVTAPLIGSRRDSLSSAAGSLDALLTRIETAPVAASYRALAQAPPLASMPRVKLLLDSLDELEREREAFGLPGGGDAEAATLAARVSEVGQTIQAIGRAKRDSLRQSVFGVSSDQGIGVAQSITDTAGWVTERDSARSLVTETDAALTNARRRADDYDREAVRTRVAQANAPPVALLGAALVIGVVLGFGVAFLGEMRHPRISDEHEVERATGVRVLATAQRRPRDPNRDRRMADRLAPPYFDPRSPAYQLAYLHVVRPGATRLSLTVTGADTSIAAVVGMNVAAIAADEARSTILIDTDAQMLPVAAALRCHAEPGMADVVRAHIDWAEVTTQTMAGRDRTIDVIPSGLSSSPLDAAALASLFRQESNRLTRHYEAIVVVATLEQAAGGLAGALPVPDAIVCARVGHTRLADLRSALDSVRAGGGNPVGVVLWDSVPPTPINVERVEASVRPIQTAEIKALTRNP